MFRYEIVLIEFIYVNFVYDCDIGIFGCLIKFYYGRGDVVGGNDIFFFVDGRFDDSSVVGVGN